MSPVRKAGLSLMPMAEEADVSLEEAIAQVVARMVKLAHDLARTKVHEDHDWFRNMLVGILISTYQNYQAVQAGVPQTPTLACWGARLVEGGSRWPLKSSLSMCRRLSLQI